MTKIFLSVFSFLLLSFSAQAADNVEDVVPEKSARQSIEDNYNDWRKNVSAKMKNNCKTKGLSLRDAKCDFNAMITYGEAKVKVKPSDPNWVNARSMAYSEALIDAYAKVAQEISLTSKNSMVKELLDDQTPPQLDPERANTEFSSLIDKLAAVAGGMLDKKLEELGVDPTQYDKAPVEKRKTLLKDAISKRSEVKAIADTTGMVPLQTFEGKDSDGTYLIRVAISKDTDRIALLKTILRQGERVAPNEAKASDKSLEDRLMLVPELMFSQFGSRLIYDEEGFPVLVSFGQAGVPNRGSSVEKSIGYESAKNLAKTSAIDSMTSLLQSSTTFRNIVNQIASESKDMKIISDKGSVIEEVYEDASYAHSIDSKTATTSQITNFAGTREFHTWSYTLPDTKQEVVGVVMIWSPETASQANSVKKAKASSTTQAPVEVKTMPGTSRGVELDDYDF